MSAVQVGVSLLIVLAIIAVATLVWAQTGSPST
jgi:hypothetical protein